MSDTTTAPDTVVKRTTAPRQVNYTLQVLDELPPSPPRSGGGAKSVHEESLSQIRDMGDQLRDDKNQAKWVQIGAYDKGTAATAAANILRLRHGPPEVEGWTFKTQRVAKRDENGQPIQGQTVSLLLVKYEPERVVEGAREIHERKLKAREAKLEADRREREAKGLDQWGRPKDENIAAQTNEPSPAPAPTPSAPGRAEGTATKTSEAPSGSPGGKTGSTVEQNKQTASGQKR